MVQSPLQGAFEASLLGRLLLFILRVWDDSVIGRLFAQLGAAVGRTFADSFIGRVWYSDWPDRSAFAQSGVGRSLTWLNERLARFGERVSPTLNGIWEHSVLMGAVRRVAGLVQPTLSTSLLYQAYTGFAADVALAPDERGHRHTSPLVYLLGTLLGLLPLIPSDFRVSPTALMILGVWGIAFLWLLSKVMTKSFSWRASSGFVPLLFLLLVAAASTLQSISPRTSLFNLIIWITGGLLFWLIVNLVRDSRDAAALLGPVLAGASLMTVWALYQFVNPPHVEEGWVDPTTSGTLVRVFASMSNPNYLAEYLALYLPLGFALWLQQPKRQFYLALPVGLMGIGLILTYSRGGWLALLIAMAIFVLMRAGRWAIFGFFGAMAVPLVAPASILRRFVSAFTLEDSSNQYRVNVWKGIVAMLHKFWVLGTGLGAEVFAKGYQEFMLPEARAAHAHNTYLQVLAEMGVLGLIAVLWALLAVIRRTFVVGVRVGSPYLVAAVPAALIGMLFHGMVEHIWYNPKLLFAFWAVAGLGMGLAMGDREESAA